MPFAVAALLARVAAVAESRRSYLITVSVVELYGERAHDLLAGPGASLGADMHLAGMSRRPGR